MRTLPTKRSRSTVLLAALAFALLSAAACALARPPVPGEPTAWSWVTRESPPDLVVYYFHRAFRCQTCLAMEFMAEETLRDDFAADLESGAVGWRVVNVEAPGSEHFVPEFELDGPALVIVDLVEGKHARRKNLDRIWELAESPPEFRSYVGRELSAWLEDESVPVPRKQDP